MNQSNEVELLSLPIEVLEEIFSYLDYENISRLREVCKTLDDVAGSCLTKGFLKVQVEHSKCLKQVKNAIPRRESERRTHKLFSKHDALQGLDTRLSLLKMTYNKYIVSSQCCFIPGKVLDELFLVLRKVKNSSQIMSVTALLQEVRDISSMAMEHFDEVIAPSFDSDHCGFSSLPYGFSSTASSFRESWNNSINSQRSSSGDVNHRFAAVQKQQKKFRRKLKVVHFKMKRHHRLILNAKKVRSTQNLEIRRLKSMIRSLNETVQGLTSQTQELSTQLQVLHNAASDRGICSDIASTTPDRATHSKVARDSSSALSKTSQNIASRKRKPRCQPEKPMTKRTRVIISSKNV